MTRGFIWIEECTLGHHPFVTRVKSAYFPIALCARVFPVDPCVQTNLSSATEIRKSFEAVLEIWNKGKMLDATFSESKPLLREVELQIATRKKQVSSRSPALAPPRRSRIQALRGVSHSLFAATRYYTHHCRSLSKCNHCTG